MDSDISVLICGLLYFNKPAAPEEHNLDGKWEVQINTRFVVVVVVVHVIWISFIITILPPPPPTHHPLCQRTDKLLPSHCPGRLKSF